MRLAQTKHSADLRMLERYWKMFQPDLAPISGKRHEHIVQTYLSYRALVAGDHKFLHQRLAQEKAPAKTYSRNLDKIVAIYDELDAAEKTALHISTILHDIGYLKTDGLGHLSAGASMIPTILAGRVDESFICSVQEMVGNHGLFSDIGVQLLPSDLAPFSDRSKMQIFILNCMDIAGKVYGNYLNLRVLNLMFDIYNDKANDPNWFIRYRMQHQLGLALYRHISLTRAQDALKELKSNMSQTEFAIFQRNMVMRFRNLSWSFLQELACDENGLSEFLRAMRLLNVFSNQFGDVPNINITVEPDFVGLERPTKLLMRKKLKDNLSNPKFPDTKLLKMTSHGSQTITIAFICDPV